MNTQAPASQWILPAQDRQAARSISTALGVPGIIAQILAARGITDTSTARDLLEFRHHPLSDPFTLTGMETAVERITHAKTRREHVRVFGDYDVDGMAATAIMVRGLARFGVEQVSHAMPNRLTEGYGINPDSIARAADDGVGLIITVDNGIAATEACDEAARRGVDVIVTDHHTLNGELPKATAVINPHQDDPEAPGAFACGSAVAFKLCTALTGEECDLDLVALATVADVVPLLRENRLLVARGLESMAARHHGGIEALIRKANLDPRRLRAEHIAFQLAPRLNACGRLSDGSAALGLLLADSGDEADGFAAELDRLNIERRAIEEVILEAAHEAADAASDTCGPLTIVSGRGWHPGVIGIVAARLMRAYWKPAVVISIDDDGVGRGSGRSVPTLHLAEALAECSDLLVKHGGHRMAAGFTVREKDLEAFSVRLQEAAKARMPDDPPARECPIDAIVSLGEIDFEFLHALDRLEPYGAENPPPVFASFGVKLEPGSASELRGGHLRCAFREGDRVIPAIGFNLADAWRPEDMPPRLDIAFRPQFNTWRGETTIQLQLRELRIGADA